MSEYTRRDIILVTFPFSDLSSLKLRPALVITAKEEDLIILGIFSYVPEKIKDSWIVVEPVSQTGLKRKSVIKTEKIAVIHHSIVKRKLGTLPQEVIILVNEVLKKTLELEK